MQAELACSLINAKAHRRRGGSLLAEIISSSVAMASRMAARRRHQGSAKIAIAKVMRQNSS